MHSAPAHPEYLAHVIDPEVLYASAYHCVPTPTLFNQSETTLARYAQLNPHAAA